MQPTRERQRALEQCLTRNAHVEGEIHVEHENQIQNPVQQKHGDALCVVNAERHGTLRHSPQSNMALSSKVTMHN